MANLSQIKNLDQKCALIAKRQARLKPEVKAEPTPFYTKETLLDGYINTYISALQYNNPDFAKRFSIEEICNYFLHDCRLPLVLKCYQTVYPYEFLSRVYNIVSRLLTVGKFTAPTRAITFNNQNVELPEINDAPSVEYFTVAERNSISEFLKRHQITYADARLLGCPVGEIRVIMQLVEEGA